ncbi:MAG: aminoglycoside phosphotransferase family protein [Pseudomonadota bacterium]
MSEDQTELSARCRALVEELGIGRAEEVADVERLTGGVASDIARVRLGGGDICVKFALPQLRVAAEWKAPVHRSAAEYAWLTVAAQVAPESAIRLFGRSETLNGFAMEFISGNDVTLWKAALLAEAPDRGEAEAVGAVLGRIHRASAAAGFDTAPFQNRDDFRALRIEPYLTYTARRHPAVSAPLNALADRLYDSDRILVHGDVSPKNILFRKQGPVILDAECATMGDPSFDPAFCINHLLLKAVHLPASRQRLLASIGRFWRAYGAHVTWEPLDALEARVCHLLPALMLARVDGKSPVEYLTEESRETVRTLAVDGLVHPAEKVAGFVDSIDRALKGRSA